MTGINCGILQNARPLSAERIKELEKEVLENNQAFAYLDGNGKLCFVLPYGVYDIKDLAWHNAYELSNDEGTFTKKVYAKTGLKTFEHIATLTKGSIDDSWQGDEPVVAEALDGTEYYTMAPSVLSFRSTAPLNEFQEVKVNGQTVDPSKYELEKGSTIIKFSIDYLETLDQGNYEVTIVSNSQTAKGDFTVKAPELNEYGFYYNLPYYANINCYRHDVDITGAFIFLENNTVVFIELGGYDISYGTFTQNGNSCSFNIDLWDEFNATATGEFSADGKVFSTTKFSVLNIWYVANQAVDYGNIECVLNPSIVASDEIYYYISNYENTEFSILPKNSIETSYTVSRNNIKDKPVTTIGYRAFYEQMAMESIEISSAITTFNWNAFYGCTKLNNIIFTGTVDQWNAIDKGGVGEGEPWNTSIPATHVQCTDGTVAL